MTDLDGLRREMRALDRDLLALVARRLALAKRVGEAKRKEGLPIRNYAVERDVLERAEAACRGEGVDPRLGGELMKLLIAESIRVQERDALAGARLTDGGERALVIGGAGAMGQWFAEFLEGGGFTVTTSDPAGPVDGYPHAGDAAAAAAEADVVLVATPPSVVDGVLADLEGATDALVFEIASLKGPFLPRLQRMAASGMRVTSLHPMWGPHTDILADKSLLVCDCGNPDATAEARALFEPTAVGIQELPVEQHDEVVAYTLGLPHAASIVFSEALRRSGYDFATLEHHGGPTFTKQVAVSRELASENKDLYYEIQRLNANTPMMYGAVEAALKALEKSVARREDFVELMDAARRYYEEGSQ